MEFEGVVQGGEVVIDRRDLLPEGAKVKVLVEAQVAAMGQRTLLDERPAKLRAAWAEAMDQMGVAGQPIPAEELRAMIAACGFKPEQNAFSREIVQMREE
jgi:hypothetical protein